MLVCRVAVVLLALASGVSAQEKPAVEAVLAKYADERKAATARPGTAAAVAAADKSADRAKAALAAGELRTAARLARDARWQLPAVPAGLPPHVGLVLGSARLRHADRVNALAFSPDSSAVAVASRDGSVRIWDLGNGTERLAYRGHPAPTPVDDKNPTDEITLLRVADVAWSPDGKRIASAGWKEVHIWDAATGKIALTLKKHARMVKGVAWSPDGKRLASIGDDKQLIVWDTTTGKDVYAVVQPVRMDAVAFAPDGKRVAAVDSKGYLVVFEPASERQPIRVLASEQKSVGLSSVAFTADGSKILLSGTDRLAKFVTVPGVDGVVGETAAPVMKFAGHTDSVPASAVSPDGKVVVTGSTDKSVRVWDAGSGKMLRQLQGHLDPVTAVAIRPDGKQIATGGADGIVKLWDLSTVDDHTVGIEATEPLWAVAVSADGVTYATGGADRTVRVYPHGKLQHTLKGHAGAVTAVAFLSPTQLASAGGDKVVKVWDIEKGKFERDLSGHTSAVLALAATGGKLYSAAADKTVKAWDVAAGKPLWSWDAKSMASAVAVSADNKRLAVGTADGTLTILDISGDKPTVIGTTAAHVAGVASAAFSPDYTQLATAGGDGMAKVWTVPAAGPPTIVARFEAPARVGATNSVVALSAVAFSPDGKQIVAAGADAVVRVYDIATGAAARELRGHTDWVTAAAFAPDGDKLIAVGADKAIRVFDIARSEAALRFGHVLPTRAVAVSADGKWIASASADKTVRVWDAASGVEKLTFSGLGDSPHAVAFLGSDKLAVGGDESKLRVWAIPAGTELKSVTTTIVFALTPTAGGTIGVWARNTTEQDEFSIVSADGTPIRPPHIEKGRQASCATITADGTAVVLGDKDGQVRVIDLLKRSPVGEDWKLSDKAIGDVALSGDRKTLFALDAGGTLLIADAARRKVTKKVPAAVSATADGWAVLLLSNDGKRVATVGADGLVKAFAADGSALREWRLPGPVNGAAFTPDAKGIVTANADGTVYRLDLP